MINREIFIGGCSRSGTTLLGAMLGAHSNCIASPESHFKTGILRGPSSDLANIDLKQALRKITQHWRYKIWKIKICETQFPDEALTQSYSRLLEWLVEQYAMSIGDSSAHIWVDHTPENITFASTLLKLFTQAKMIHIVRDGRGVASSIMPLDWGPNTVQTAAYWWTEMVAYGLAAEMHLGPQRIMRVRYEDLLEKTEDVLREICSFVEIDYQSKMAEARGFKVPNYSAKQHSLLGRNPDVTRVSAWKHMLTRREIELFEYFTRDFLLCFDYPLIYGLSARKPTLLELIFATINEVYRSGFQNKLRWLGRSYRFWLSRD